MRTAGITNRSSKSFSLVFPGLITKLCLEAGVTVCPFDVMANDCEAAPVDKLTIAKSASQSNVYVEPMEQTFLKQDMSLMIDEAVSSLKAAFAEQIASLKAELLESVGNRSNSARDGTDPTPLDLGSSSQSTARESSGFGSASSSSEQSSGDALDVMDEE